MDAQPTFFKKSPNKYDLLFDRVTEALISFINSHIKHIIKKKKMDEYNSINLSART